MIIFDKVIDIIIKKRREICIKIISRNPQTFIPKIYYIGMGKTGSTAIKRGFRNVNVAHWHSTKYFEKLFECNLLSKNNYDLYDLVIYIGQKYKFKPVIIECIREPISRKLSEIFQHIKIDRNHGDDCEICKIKSINDLEEGKNYVYNILKKNLKNISNIKKTINNYKKFNIELDKEFDLNKNYYYYNSDKFNLLVLKFENIDEWFKVLNSKILYKFSLKKYNVTNNKLYEYVKKNLKINIDELKLIYSNKYLNFYSQKEISQFLNRWIDN